MFEYLLDSQLDKLHSNVTGLTPRLSLAMKGTDENNFPHNSLFTTRQIAGIHMALQKSHGRI